MKVIKCSPIEGAGNDDHPYWEEEGNAYHLALGPEILKKISLSYKDVMPNTILEKIQKWCDENNESAMSVVQSNEKMAELQKINILTPEDAIELSEAEQNHNNSTLKNVLRKMNGHRLLKHPYFKAEFEDDELAEMDEKKKTDIFFEEIMPNEDYPEVMGEVNAAVFGFKFGLDLEGKLKLASTLAEARQAETPIQPSSN